MRIGLAIDEIDWHARALLKAAAAAGVSVTTFRLADAEFDTSRPAGLSLPGFTDRLPDAVLVRAISGGSFEEVTRRLGVLHALRELGVPVWNDARAIERCVDKSMASFMLAHAGIPTPPTWAVEGRAAATAIAERECPAGPLVLKPLFGSQGRGLQRIATPAELPADDAVGGVYYLQRFLRTGTVTYEDHRLFVCAGAPIAAMTRQADSWVTNMHLGAKPLKLRPDAEFMDLAVRATRATGSAYAGVDLLRDRDGKTWVLEVNSMPGWRGLQRVSEISIAERIVNAIKLARHAGSGVQ